MRLPTLSEIRERQNIGCFSLEYHMRIEKRTEDNGEINDDTENRSISKWIDTLNISEVEFF